MQKTPFSPRPLTPFGCLWLLTGLNLFNYLNRHLISAVLTPIKTDLVLTDGELGRIAATMMLGYTLMCPLGGYLGDKFNRNWLIGAGAILWAGATLSVGLANSFILLLGMQFVVGVGQSLFTAVAPGLFSDVFIPAKRNNALSIYFTAIPLGSALSFLLGGLLSQQIGWRNTFVVSAIPVFLLAGFFFFVVHPKRGALCESSESSSAVEFKFKAMFQLFRLRDFNLNAWAYTAYHFALGAFAFWGPAYLTRNYAIPPHQASMALGAVLVVTGVLGTLVGGFWSTRWQRRQPNGYAMVCAISTLGAGVLSAVALSVGSPVLSLSLMVVVLFLIFLPTGPINTLILETSPVHLRSSGMALVMLMMHVFGDMWSPEIVGRLADVGGKLEYGLSILPVAFLIAAGLWANLAYVSRRTV